MTPYLCGIEFEYMLIEREAGRHRIRDFSNLGLDEVLEILSNRPGIDDPAMATGDLGIKHGYWYPEGDERFHADGRFSTMAVKGVEIRTPPRPSVSAAMASLIEIEHLLSRRLATHRLELAISGFNPERARYDFVPPLNAFERELRERHRAYDGAHVSTLSYGPDINLSFPSFSAEQALAAARRLNACAPFIVPFSFSSPFHAGAAWPGESKRTWERSPLRPAVKLYLREEDYRRLCASTSLVHRARIPSEHGRIEFKAFDAHPSAELLAACAQLLVGLCLDEELAMQGEHSDVGMYRLAAREGFGAGKVAELSACLLESALRAHPDKEARQALRFLENNLMQRETPAQLMRKNFSETGLMYKPGGLACRQSIPFESENEFILLS